MLSDRNRFRLHICITAAVMIFIFVQSALPGYLSGAESSFIVKIVSDITGWDEEPLRILVRKGAHFTEFLILGICLCASMRDLQKRRTAKTVNSGRVGEPQHITAKYMFAAWLIGTAYAITDELHQLFVPGRACSPVDVCIDSAGVACGVLAYLLIDCRSSKI